VPRRTFLKRSGTAILSITLVDLIHPLESFADPSGATCKGYYANGFDEDGTCGTNKGGAATKDGDEGCNTGTDTKDADANCGNSTSKPAIKDSDGSCGFSTNNGFDGDASCGKITSSSGAKEGDEACNAGLTSGTTDTDANCSSTEEDQLCGPVDGALAPDVDQHCGWGAVPEADDSCKIGGNPDHRNDPQP